MLTIFFPVFSSISFLTDVLLVNRSNEALSVQGYFANLKRLNFFYSGKYIGTAKPVVTGESEKEIVFSKWNQSFEASVKK